jgi:hypothetical protein
LWPYGLADIKQVSQIRDRKTGQYLTTAERVITYLAKYLSKSFELRADKG